MVVLYRPYGSNYSFDHHFTVAGILENEAINGLSYTRDSDKPFDFICCSMPSELLSAIEFYGARYQYLLWCDEPLWIGLHNVELTAWRETVSSQYNVAVYVITHINQPLDWHWHSFLTPYYLRKTRSKNITSYPRVLYLGEYRISNKFHYSLSNCFSLSTERTKFAMRLWTDAICDIMGKGWDESISRKLHTRDGDWTQDKYDLLAGYSHNLCMENTHAPNYVTEKLWQSVDAGCLPVYYYGPLIHSTQLNDIMKSLKDFSVDISSLSYASAKDLISGLSASQYSAKINAAQDIFHDVQNNRLSEIEIAETIVRQIKQIVL